MNDDNFAEIATAVRDGINDAFRLGVGSAIKILLEYRHITTDPTTWDAAIAHLQHLSLTSGSQARS